MRKKISESHVLLKCDEKKRNKIQKNYRDGIVLHDFQYN